AKDVKQDPILAVLAECSKFDVSERRQRLLSLGHVAVLIEQDQLRHRVARADRSPGGSFEQRAEPCQIALERAHAKGGESARSDFPRQPAHETLLSMAESSSA